MDKEKEIVKIEDIAKKAGVSITAVSFALNDKPGISAKTRKKILDIVEDYGYISKPMVRSTDRAERLTKSILLLNCSRTNVTSNEFDKAPFFTELLKVLERRVSEHGYRFWVKSIHIDSAFRANVEQLLSDDNIDGIALIATDMSEEDAACILSFQPNTVAIDTFFNSLDINCVAIDNYLGGAIAAKHILECGHQHIGYIQSSDRIYNFEMRKKGFVDVLNKNNRTIDEAYTFTVEGNSVEASSKALHEAIKKNDAQMPSAFFAENDYRAIGLIRALQDLDYTVPDRVAVVGFDNIEMASFITPGLTTIRVPISNLADLSIKTLIKMIEKKVMCNVKQMVSVDLMVRKSTQ